MTEGRNENWQSEGLHVAFRLAVALGTTKGRSLLYGLEEELEDH